MTFYWWSHWFWITKNLHVIAALLLLLHTNANNYVQTYPSQQELSAASHTRTFSVGAEALSDGGRGGRVAFDAVNANVNANNEMQKSQKLHQITKLYQTTASQNSWAATTVSPLSAPIMLAMSSSSPSSAAATTTTTSTTTASAATATTRTAPIFKQRSIISKELTQEYKRSIDFDKSNQRRSSNNSNNGNASANDGDDDDDDDGNDDAANKAGHDEAAPQDSMPAGSQAVDAAQMLNNYTNYSRRVSTKTTTTAATTTTTLLPANNNSNNSNMSNSAYMQSTTNIMPLLASNKTTTVNYMGVGVAESVSLDVATTQSGVTGGAATPSTPQINTDQQQQLAVGETEEEQQHQRAPFTLENVNAEDELRRAEFEHRARKSKVLSVEYKHINRFINFSSDTKSLLTRSASTAPNDFEADEGNISSEALSIQRTYFLDAGAISAICCTVFGICCTVGTIGIVLYRRRYLNKPQALSEPDSSVYIDDSTMRENSDEMYSLDNDSFLNSLEAMTIQNYWTDTVKHTKL